MGFGVEFLKIEKSQIADNRTFATMSQPVAIVNYRVPCSYIFRVKPLMERLLALIREIGCDSSKLTDLYRPDQSLSGFLCKSRELWIGPIAGSPHGHHPSSLALECRVYERRNVDGQDGLDLRI